MTARRRPANKQSTLRHWLPRLVAVLALVLCGYLLYELGRIQAGFNVLEATENRRALEYSITALEAEVRALREQVVLLETDAAIDAQSYREVESRLTALRNKVQEQVETIEFYRGIVAPDDGLRDLRVQTVRISGTQEENRYALRLVLVKTLRNDAIVKGNIVVQVAGNMEGSAGSLDGSVLFVDGSGNDWPYSFRYFKNAEREIALPPGFIPDTINVELRSRTKGVSDVSQSFPWQVNQP
jgi:cell division protein FtsB